jgi:hypothetical protein
MRKTDVAFLCSVLSVAGLVAGRLVTRSLPLLPGATAPATPALGAAGQARDVDMLKLQRLLERRTLSDHEAEFYEPVGPPSRPAVGSEGVSR